MTRQRWSPVRAAGLDKAPAPEPLEQDGTGDPEESAAGYRNNAGYQGEAKPKLKGDDKLE